jgi:hypothetical protein
LRPGDLVVFDNNGLAVADRVVGYGSQPLVAALDARYWGGADLTGAGNALAQAGLGNAGQALGHQMAQNQHSARIPTGAGMAGGSGMVVPLEAQVPIGQFMLQAEQQAGLARRRLQEDVAAIERYNQDVNEVNDRATLTLKVALMEDFGPDRRGWERWWTEQGEVSSAAPARSLDSSRSQETPETAARARAASPGFGAGTLVWTRSGPRPIEDIRAGDRLLTHDTSSGSLSFSPVLAIRGIPPCPVESIEVGDEVISATDLERLWVAGKGWVMVRDLKPQDMIRVLRGATRLASVKSLAPRPGYHVRVAEGRGIFVGRSGILVHDERPARPVLAPFDAVTMRAPHRIGRSD